MFHRALEHGNCLGLYSSSEETTSPAWYPQPNTIPTASHRLHPLQPFPNPTTQPAQTAANTNAKIRWIHSPYSPCTHLKSPGRNSHKCMNVCHIVRKLSSLACVCVFFNRWMIHHHPFFSTERVHWIDA